MSYWRAPLWKQLAALWLGAVALDVGLVWLTLHRPYRFYWIIPYPNWRLARLNFVVLFRDMPLLGAALTVPFVVVGATAALCLWRVIALVRRTR